MDVDSERHATQADLAVHLDLSVTKIKEYQGTGVIPKGATRDVARVAYIRHLRAIKSGVTDQRQRLDAARADREEMKAELDRGAVVPAADLDRALIAVATAVSARLQAIPTQVAPELATAATPVECQRIVEEAISGALSDLADKSPRARSAHPGKRAGSAAGDAASTEANGARVGRGGTGHPARH